MTASASVAARSKAAVERMLEPERSERTARGILALAALAYVALALWLTRGASFTLDELSYLGAAEGFSPGSLASPFGGHLTAVTRAFFEASLRLFGTAHLPFQLFLTILVVAAAVLTFALVRRRVGPLAALAPAVMLLFLGSTPEVLQAGAMMWVQASAAGLGAFLALDRGSRGGDALACALLVVAVLSFEVGVAFALGAVVWIVAERGRHRLWVPLVPLALYLAWWIWALKFDDVDRASTDDLLLLPSYSAESLAAAAAALTGLGIDLTGGPTLFTIATGWGRLAAIAAVALAVFAVRRSSPPASFWGALTLLVSLWVSLTLSFGLFTEPTAARFAYPVAIGLILVLAASFAGTAPSRRVLLALLVAVALALPANIWLMRERGEFVRAKSDEVRAILAMIELEREIVPPDYAEGVDLPVRAADYLGAATRFGSFAFSIDELAAESADTRERADETLVAIVSPGLTPVVDRRLRCIGAGREVELPPGGGVVRSLEGGGLRLRRFADRASIEIGSLEPGVPGRIDLPVDDAARPWFASLASGALEVCAVGRRERS